MSKRSESPPLALAKQRLWEELDRLEQRCLVSEEEEVEAELPKSRYKKPDKKKKLDKIRAYEDALRRHRSSNYQFYSPTDPVDLKINSKEAIKMLKEAMKDEQKRPKALRSLGLKRIKILFQCGAMEQFSTLAKFLETGEMPSFIGTRYRELSRQKKDPALIHTEHHYESLQ